MRRYDNPYCSHRLSLAGILALIFGLVLWTVMALNIISLHMLLGLLAVAALWVIGIGQALVRGGSWIIAACAVIVGALTSWLGMIQASLLVGDYHWIIQVIHLFARSAHDRLGPHGAPAIGEPPRNSAGSSFCPTSGTKIPALHSFHRLQREYSRRSRVICGDCDLGPALAPISCLR